MKCNNCQKDTVFQSQLMSSMSGVCGFYLEPNKGKIVKKGIEPDVWICQDCGNIQFFVNKKDIEKVKSIS